MFAEAMLAVALLGGLLASYTDFKMGIIPNRLTLPLTAIGIVGYLLSSMLNRDLSLFLSALKGFLPVAIAGYLLWFAGMLSAGDSKVLMFLAALVPLYPGFLSHIFSPTLPPYPFPLAYLINSLLAAFPFIFLWGLWLVRRRRKFSRLKLDYGKYAMAAFVLLAAFLFSELTHSIAFIFFIAAVFLIRERWQKFLVVALTLIAYLALQQSFEVLGVLVVRYIVLLAIISVAGIFLALLAMVRRHALTREVKLSELEEGMIAGEEIYIRDGKLIKEEPDYMRKAREMLRGKRREMLVGTRASGLTGEEIEQLSSLAREGKIGESIKVKEKIPLTPVIYIGFVLSLIFGDLSVVLRETV